MSDDQRVYSDEEFALILRKAAELATRAESPAGMSAGLTLTEIKAAAAQAGLDPAFVERAAWLMTASVTESPFERLIGGPVRLNHETRFPVKLDETGAARLLSAVRIIAGLAGRRDVGHSSSMGMTWHDGGELESLGITARPDENQTTVSIALDRRGTLSLVAMVSGIATFFTVLFAVFALYPESPALGVGGFVAGIGGVLATARGYWASSTKKVRDRIGVVMDAVGQTLNQPGEARASIAGTGGGDTAAPELDSNATELSTSGRGAVVGSGARTLGARPPREGYQLESSAPD